MPGLIIRAKAEFTAAGNDLSNSIIFPIEDVSFDGKNVHNAALLGWTVQPETQARLQREGAILFPAILDDERPYSIYRRGVYSAAELMQGFDGASVAKALDSRTYEWYSKCGGDTPLPVESIMQRLHDFLIGEALDDIVAALEAAHRPVIGFMGGHDMSRNDPSYRDVVRLAQLFTRKGYCVLTGGGPGVMEAANLGAFLAPQSDESVIDEALALLASAPTFADHAQWIRTAQDVIARFGGPAAQSAPWGWISDAANTGNPGESVSIPTWLYGFEPPNLFGSHIAKYFSNSVREDGLVTVAKGGIIYAEGSGGTVQEVFADAAQNYYMTYGASAMVLFGTKAWKETIPVWQCLEALAAKSADPARPRNPHFPAMIACLDDMDEVFAFIEQHAWLGRT